jgi:16S rRNA (guanine966-N2)-methyltransferase
MPSSNQSRKAPSGVRIIAGRWRGRRLRLPPATSVRPTPDRVRETVFNWLAPLLPGAACLDLYAGSGALAFEALSRGAARAVLVERDPALVAALEAVTRLLEAEARILAADAHRFLQGPAAEAFDLAFLDPPYAEPLPPLLSALRPWLAPGALVYVERSRAEGLPALDGLEWHRQARAGAVCYGLARLTGAGGYDEAG